MNSRTFVFVLIVMATIGLLATGSEIVWFHNTDTLRSKRNSPLATATQTEDPLATTNSSGTTEPSIVTSFVVNGTAETNTKSADFLCNEGGTVCVATSVKESRVSNPLDVAVSIRSSSDVEIDWELEDGSGTVLEGGSTYDYSDPQAAFQQQSSSSRTFVIKGYVLKPSNTDSGFLVLSPSMYDSSSGTVYLPRLSVPVGLDIGTTTLTIVVPGDLNEYQSEVQEWYSSDGSPAAFEPKTPFIAEPMTVMRTTDVVGATADAALQSTSGQSQSRWYVTAVHVDSSGTASLEIAGSGWAGVSAYWIGLEPIIRRSLLQVPGITQISFN